MTSKQRSTHKEKQPESGVTLPWLNDSRALFIIVAATFLVYSNSLSGAFVFDDTKQIVGNPTLHTWNNILRAFSNDVWSFQRGTLTADIPPPYYRPLFTAYLTINYQLFGLWEPGWHLMNLLIHAGASVLVYFLIKRLSSNQLIAALGALLFSLHPAHVESVSWISGIPDPLSALFYIPSLIWYLRYRDESNTRWLFLSLLFYGLAALCKETPLTLPIILAVVELTRESRRRLTAEKLIQTARLLIPYALVGAGYLALRYSVLGRLSWKHPYMAHVPDSSIWMTVPYVAVNYLRHLVVPFHLSLIYGTQFLSNAADPKFLVSVLLLLALAAAVYIWRETLSAQVWIALALTVAPLLPVLNLSVFHYEYIIQDRYLYLPSIGFCYLVAMFVVWLGQTRRSLALALTGCLLIAYAVSTNFQNRVWHSAVQLWQRALDFAPSSWSTHYNLGLAYLDVRDYDLAAGQLMEAKRLNPGKAVIYNNLALAQSALGDKQAAIQNLKTALSLESDLLEAHNNLGALMYDESDYEGAKREFGIVLQRDPASLSARFNLARTMAAEGNHTAAITELETVTNRQPEDIEAHYQLALSYSALGRNPEAIKQIQIAQSYHPDAQTAQKLDQKLVELQRK